MIQTLFTTGCRKKISWVLFSILVVQTIYPAASFALSSGPVQPEAQGFEPVGTTDMVDLFTGDFVYNIPLMDVEGYPINISYHGGVGMEQEASWVGLGWNINPGAVNRAVRGLPDDFAGDTVEKHFYVKPEKTTKVGLSVGAELLGFGDPYIRVGADMGGYLTLSNYRGVSVDFTTDVGVNAKVGAFNAGVNAGVSVGSQTGAAINYGAQWGIGLNFNVGSDVSAGASFNMNTGGNYSPRTGTHDYRGMGIKVSLSERTTGAGTSFSMGTSVPIGMQNHTAAITNPSYTNTYSGQLKLGGELYSVYLHGQIFGSFTKTEFGQNGSRRGYGYFNLDLANQQGHDLLDFSREKDGMYNATMDILPQSHLTYDVYSVSGQGTGGSFRPHRNDIGSIYDPMTESSSTSDDVHIEAGLGNLFEVGGEYKHGYTDMSSGLWDEYSRRFHPRETSGLYEDFYFKEAGELSENNQSYLATCGGTGMMTPEGMSGQPEVKPGGQWRVTRANHIYPVYAAERDTPLLLDGKQLVSYQTQGFKTYPNITKTLISRLDAGDPLKRKAAQVSEIIQLQKDGRRYIYGLPVMNNVEREAVYAIGGRPVNKSTFSVEYPTDQVGDDRPENGNGRDHFYSSSVTPSYVAAHLLTGVLSSDYVDVTGDGISDDDLGTYTKFNYTRKSKDYRWRSPIDSDKAQYIPGFITDTRDDKATYVIGSRENWMMHSVETKNYVAEFYVSPRNDAKGVNNKILSSQGLVYHDAKYLARGHDSDQKSYKLDSIVLYNKHDRFTNGANAQSIKTVLFTYDYSLCQGVPNAPGGTGKLTLRGIQMRYGHSNINMSAGYTFNYSSKNYNYSSVSKDRWGTYKPNDSTFNNYEFPFTTQTSATDEYAQAWSLTEIGLPSGGQIKVDYESDDYAYVQDMQAMEMFKVAGVGNSNNYDDGNELYHNADQPNLFLYFNRRSSGENPQLSFRDNYLKGTSLLYYNVPVQLADGKFEPIKGYAQVASIGICPNDNQRGYVELVAQQFERSDGNANPITYTALNIGRYNLPHIMFPGSNPENSDISNVVAGLKNSFGELFNIAKNPIQYYMEQSRAKEADLAKSFVRLTSPGLKKKGGGQRVRQIRFYDKWADMAGGNDAVYGKTYDYTIQREDKKGFISSGVASWEPVAGGDELPQRQPKPFEAQAGSKFPPNDPVDLYQELPIGESFFPAPVVGYRKVTSRSIHKDEGRSSQTEDVNYFYTAKEFPIETDYSPIRKVNHDEFELQNTKIESEATQGFTIKLNDMHGKPLNTEHWVLKPDTGSKARELVSYQRNEYLGQIGRLSSDVPVIAYSGTQGALSLASRKLGLETDITVDTRKKFEHTQTDDYSVNVNGFIVGVVPIVIPIPYPWGFENSVSFKSATVTKVIQQYGVLSKVTSFNQGAVTELKNEAFDPQTGNAIITSVNNEYKDREYSVSYPAHWAYKEMGPSFENQNMQGVFKNTFIIDTFGTYTSRFINYNGAYSHHYDLPSNMPIALTAVDEDMPMYKLGDQMLLQLTSNSNPVRTWVMGYTSDTSHCYLVLAPREPYVQSGVWQVGQNLSAVPYRVIQSGNKNRLGETIQTYTTTDRNNIFPALKDTLFNLISYNAKRYNHNLNQVYAANVSSDSLNPFVTGKVGTYRPEMDVINLKNRNYNNTTARKQGTYNTRSYWPTEKSWLGYCMDSTLNYEPIGDTARFCADLVDSIKVSKLTGGYVRLDIYPHASNTCDTNNLYMFANWSLPYHAKFPSTAPKSVTYYAPIYSPFHAAGFTMEYSNGCCNGAFEVIYNDSNSNVTISRYDYSNPAVQPGVYYNNGSAYGGTPQPFTILGWGYGIRQPQRIRKKILLGKVGHYDGTDNENWVKTNQVTKYNWYGAELENKEEGIGYNSAVYGYNQQLPACVAKNARAGEVLFDGFEDYALLQAKPTMREQYRRLLYSPFAAYLSGVNGLGSLYQLSTLVGSNSVGFSISNEDAHTGVYSLKTDNSVTISLNPNAATAKGYSFGFDTGRTYIASLWLKPQSVSSSVTTLGYAGHASIIMDTVLTGGPTSAKITRFLGSKSNIIDGWQQYEVTFKVPSKYKDFQMVLDAGYYYDDIRIFPSESNCKSFVYHPVTRKLMATLDENNYATLYEYDAEGNLIRTKKETEQGIMTVSESRSTHRKIQ